MLQQVPLTLLRLLQLPLRKVAPRLLLRKLPQPPLRKPAAEPKLQLHLLPLLLSNRFRSILIDIAQPLRSTI